MAAANPAFPIPVSRLAAIAALAGLGAVAGAAIAAGGLAALILVVAAISCVFILRDWRVGAVLLVLIMPISQSYVFPHEMFGIKGMNPLNLLMAATLGVYVMYTAGKGELGRFLPRSVGWLYVAPIVVGALLGMGHAGEIPAFFRDTEMIYFSEPVGYVRDMLMKPMLWVLYALLVAAAVVASKEPRRFIAPMVVSVVVMSALSLVFFVASGVSLSSLAGSYSRQFLSPLGMHANDLGRLYACAYALLLFTWDRTGSVALKTTLFGAMVLVVLALLITFSRGAFFGFILVNVIYLFSRRRVKTLVLASLAIPVALYLTPGAVWYRMTLGLGEGLNALSAGRVGEIWAPLQPHLLDSPLWGKGLGSIMWSRPMIEERMLQVGHPHNAYLQAFMDTGVLGLVLVVLFWIHIWRRFRFYASDARLGGDLQGFFEGAAAGLVAFLVAGMAGSSLFPVPAQAFLWLAIGMMFGIRRRLGDPVNP